MPKIKFSTLHLAWAALAVNALIILQGAYVRASGSGAGCGRHWPTCHGSIIPVNPTLETLTEFSHRLMTTTVLVLGIWLIVATFRSRKVNPMLFKTSLVSFAFLIVEALLGAATVLWELTGDNVSTARGLMVSVHMVNSMLLIGALTLNVVYARKDRPAGLGLKHQGAIGATLAVGLLGMLLLIFSGGIAAMGNTMFPSATLADGFAADLNPDSNILIRLRMLHPIIAIGVFVYLLLSLGLSRWLKPEADTRHLARALFIVYGVQLLIGALNWRLLAPIPLQILHLGTAVLAFAILTALVAYTLSAPHPAVRKRVAPDSSWPEEGAHA